MWPAYEWSLMLGGAEYRSMKLAQKRLSSDLNPDLLVPQHAKRRSIRPPIQNSPSRPSKAKTKTTVEEAADLFKELTEAREAVRKIRKEYKERRTESVQMKSMLKERKKELKKELEELERKFKEWEKEHTAHVDPEPPGSSDARDTDGALLYPPRIGNNASQWYVKVPDSDTQFERLEFHVAPPDKYEYLLKAGGDEEEREGGMFDQMQNPAGGTKRAKATELMREKAPSNTLPIQIINATEDTGKDGIRSITAEAYSAQMKNSAADHILTRHLLTSWRIRLTADDAMRKRFVRF